MRIELLALAALGDDAKRAWTKAAKEGIGYILLLKKNNPKSDLRQLLARPDAQQALHAAGVKAASLVQRSIRDMWRANGGNPSSVFLKQLLKDSAANGRSFEAMARSLLDSPDGADLRKLVSKFAFRQAAGMAVAVTRAKGEAALVAAKKAGRKEMVWRTTSGHPCEECLALEGTRVSIGREFPHFAGGRRLKVFLNLLCPPRHPFCRCVLETI